MQQEAQVPQTKRDVYLELLSREGLCHWIDEDGDVAFWSSGHLFVLFPNERDRDLFQIAAPNIWTFGPDESERAFMAANSLSLHVSMVKAVLVGNFHVWLSIEQFLVSEKDAVRFLRTAIDTLLYAKNQFIDEVRQTRPLLLPHLGTH
jgi:hypothetical protein